jgi:hypothetical protein
MRRNVWIRCFLYIAFVYFQVENNSNSENVSTEGRPMQFSYTTNGAAGISINKYGNNEVSVSGDLLRVQIGDSARNINIGGVGIYELKLSGANLESARQMAELLCSPKDPDSDVTLPDLYIVKCGEEMRSSSVGDFNRAVLVKISGLMNRLKNLGVQSGRKLVKFDVSLISIDRARDGFFVSVRFINGGDYPIKFKTPDRWDTGMGKDSLGVSDTKSGMSAKFGLGLAGQSLVEPAQFPDGEINLAPHSAVDLKIKTNNINKFSAGTYDLYAGAFMSMEVIGIQSSLLYVDFHSDYENPTRITFDRDYPSTPQEREQWEATRRRAMSWQPVNPGEAFPEDGLYRAIRTGSGARSLQVQPFKAGDVATTDNVRLLSASGEYLDGPMQWVWEASPPVPGPQPFTIMAGTEQFIKAGAVCPRSGRWIARFRTHDWKYGHDLSQIVAVAQGKPMPPIRDGANADWEWLGV